MIVELRSALFQNRHGLQSVSLRVVLAITAAMLGSGCVVEKPPRHFDQPAAVLLQADRDFAAFAQAHGVAEAFHEFAAPDAWSLPVGEAPLRGREAIYQSMLDLPAGELIWSPVAADLSRSGDLGYTWGTYEFRTRDAANQPVTRHGKYVTIWKMQSDGAWKYVLDTGNSSPPPK